MSDITIISVLMTGHQGLDAVECEPYPGTPGYYLPHHAVVRKEAVMTKVRVVFNEPESMKDCKFLNNILDPGPSLLPYLNWVLLRF